MSEPDWLRVAREKGLSITEGPVARLPDVPLPSLALSLDLSEAEFQKIVIDAARLHGWLAAHFRPARVRRGGKDIYETPVAADGKGWPDLVLVRGPTILAAELKSQKGKASADQVKWLDALRATGMAAGVWRPADLEMIERTLRTG